MSRKNRRENRSNRNAFILHRDGYTFTKRRDPESLKVSARTDGETNATEVVITRYGASQYSCEKLVLDGREARTLQRVLNKHYGDV